ncbi:MAG TPA: cytochrome c peroxidase [Woeseiaceae bacterium]|nr:cytochrome c peroxidase [Woeseiaceae bacterium]
MGRPGYISRLLFLAALSVAIGWYAWQRYADPAPWSSQELEQITALWIQNLPKLSPNPANAVADDPRAAELGHRLFFDPRLSSTGQVSCATCHQPIRNFTDGLPKAVAIGVTERNTPSIVGTAYSPWFFWDGRTDSLWAQALAPLEHPNEHGSSRQHIAALLAWDTDYRQRYEELFGVAPQTDSQSMIDRTFANVGKSIAAYERLLLPGESRFDRYVAHLVAGGDYLKQDILGIDEIRGLRLFVGDAHCTDCHNGPLFTNFEFHNTGLLPPSGELPERGRIDGVREVLRDPFNCLGDLSDDPQHTCMELRHTRTGPELIGATRTPSLRNLENTMPFQSKGQFETLSEVLEHYNRAPLAIIGHNEAKPLRLADWQLQELESFLGTLAAPIAVDEKWLEPAPASKPLE